MDSIEQRLAECLRLFEETGDIRRCLELYPDLEEELDAHFAFARRIDGIAPPDPPPASERASRRLLLSSLTKAEGGRGMFSAILKSRVAVAIAAAGLLASGAVGAGAAGGGINSSGPVNHALSRVGVVEKAPSLQSEDNHGSNVSENVHQAIESSTPGPGRGQGVSEAACEAAHNKLTLPTPAQDAPGHNKEKEKDCEHPNADGTPGRGKPTPSLLVVTPIPTATPILPATPTPEHGRPFTVPPGHDKTPTVNAAMPQDQKIPPGQAKQEPAAPLSTTPEHGRPANPGQSSNAPGQQRGR
jgi:hypothetical protein